MRGGTGTMITLIGFAAVVIIAINYHKPNNMYSSARRSTRRDLVKTSKAAPLKWFALGIVCLVIVLR
jgi:hypothetical protein